MIVLIGFGEVGGVWRGGGAGSGKTGKRLGVMVDCLFDPACY